METMNIAAGDMVVVVDAAGNEHTVRALSGIETEGHTFPVVWIARPLKSGDTDRVPWPAESVKPA
jgi:hypothetical protein